MRALARTLGQLVRRRLERAGLTLTERERGVILAAIDEPELRVSAVDAASDVPAGARDGRRAPRRDDADDESECCGEHDKRDLHRRK